jgi:hypothetical protein
MLCVQARSVGSKRPKVTKGKGKQSSVDKVIVCVLYRVYSLHKAVHCLTEFFFFVFIFIFLVICAVAEP